MRNRREDGDGLIDVLGRTEERWQRETREEMWQKLYREPRWSAWS
jgi:hypothetical protein